jgi:hypothetical protein
MDSTVIRRVKSFRMTGDVFRCNVSCTEVVTYSSGTAWARGGRVRRPSCTTRSTGRVRSYALLECPHAGAPVPLALWLGDRCAYAAAMHWHAIHGPLSRYRILARRWHIATQPFGTPTRATLALSRAMRAADNTARASGCGSRAACRMALQTSQGSENPETPSAFPSQAPAAWPSAARPPRRSFWSCFAG